jgi:hypothetical protein
MTEKKANNNLRTFLGFLVVCIIIFFSIYNEKRMDDQREKEDNEYVQIEKSNNEYKGRILSKKESKGYKGRTLVYLNNNGKFTISGGGRNYLYSNQDLSYFMQIDDSIFKPLNTDSLYIIRNNRKYYFILGQIIKE